MKRDTKIGHAGRRKEWTHGVINPPVYHASTCLFETHAELRAAVKDPDAGLFYGRKGTPTTWALQDALLELEGGDGCRLFSSGLAAVTTAILAFVKPGDHVLITDSAYEPSRLFALGHLKRFGVETTFFDPLVGAGIADLMRETTKVVFLESPGSLTFEVQDVPAIAEAAHANDAVVVVDNTWATPLFFNAFEHGADVVVHACTKYISGHADAMLGSTAAKGRAWPALRRATYQLGHVAGPDDAYLGLRGLRTLGVRLERHEKNALQVAQWLAERPEVDRVLHPALPGCPGHDIWKRDFSGSSGLFSITLNFGDYETIGAMVDDMHLFKMGFSWGGYESLILPANPAPDRAAREWNAPGPLLRLHIGLEDPADLIAELEEALVRYAAAAA